MSLAPSGRSVQDPVVGVFMRAVLGDLRRRTRVHGVQDGRSGAVAILQRFGAALNVNVHVHALVLDGVFAENECGGLSFRETRPPTDEEMDTVLGVTVRRLRRLLIRRGVLDENDGASGRDSFGDDAPALAGIAAASVQSRVAIGPRAGAKTRRCGGSPEMLALRMPAGGPCHARRDGFDLHAGVVVPGRDRARLERVCRYALRPPVAHDRLHGGGDGDLELRHRWADGTTHLRFDPVELIERLAALTPRPRINLVLYYGVLGAHAAWRSRVTAGPARASSPTGAAVPTTGSTPTTTGTGSRPPRSNLLWAQLMQRSFGFDVLACLRCGGRLRLIALIEAPDVIRRILAHLELPTEVPSSRPSRAPPLRFGLADDSIDAP